MNLRFSLPDKRPAFQEEEFRSERGRFSFWLGESHLPPTLKIQAGSTPLKLA